MYIVYNAFFVYVCINTHIHTEGYFCPPSLFIDRSALKTLK